MIDQQALAAGNYVGVTEIPGAKRRKKIKGAPVILCCAPRAPLSEMWGHAHVPRQLHGNGAYDHNEIFGGGGYFTT